MDKYDVKYEYGHLYSAPTSEVVEVDVPEFGYLAVDGEGDPNTAPAYAEAVAALYAVSYRIKFTAKRELGRDAVVAPLEGLWWADDMTGFRTRDKRAWRWTMLITQPPWITGAMIESAIAAVRTGKDLPGLEALRPLRFAEGRCVQILHVGPYDAEGPTIEMLHRVGVFERGLALRGRHHEIYLGDPRRAAPDTLRTILRQPVTVP